MRAQVGRAAYDLNVNQYCCGGLNFGYFYDASPIIAYDGEAAPGYTMADFTPSTVPGCRMPHLWLRDGRSLYDALGPGFTLLRRDRSVEVDGLVAAAAPARRAAGRVSTWTRTKPRRSTREGSCSSRPDQHVAWRGDRAPADPLALMDLIRGAASAPAQTEARAGSGPEEFS